MQHPAPSIQHPARRTQHPSTQHPVSSSQHPNKQPSETPDMRSNRHHLVRDLYLPVPRTQHPKIPAESIAVHAAPSTQYPAPSTKHTAPQHPAPSIWLTAPQQTTQRNSLFSLCVAADIATSSGFQFFASCCDPGVWAGGPARFSSVSPPECTRGRINSATELQPVSRGRSG